MLHIRYALVIKLGTQKGLGKFNAMGQIIFFLKFKPPPYRPILELKDSWFIVGTLSIQNQMAH